MRSNRSPGFLLGTLISLGVMIALAALPIAADVCNLGFETGGISPWVAFNSVGTTTASIQPAPRTGTYAVRLEQSTSGNKGGVYQRFPVTAGQQYTITAYCLSGSANNAARMRVDAAGGTNYTVYTSQANQGILTAYTLMSCGAVTATSSYITVFLAQESLAGALRYCSYDDVSVTPVIPTAASASPASVDAGQSSSFSVTGAYGTRVGWYSDATCTTYVGEGNPFNLTSIMANTTLYARNEVTCAAAVTGYSTTPSAVSASVTVGGGCTPPAAPTNVAANPTSISAGGSATLSVIAESGCTVDWYSGSCGLTLVGSGTTLVVTPGITTAYYPRARNTTTGCVSTSCGSTVSVTVGIPPSSVHYVKSHVGGTHNGLSWATAFDTIQEAVNASVSTNEVWVASGTYTENVVLASGVVLYGGFVGTETLLTQRNWTTNISVIDGNWADSTVEVVRNATTSTRIDGFTIINGRAITGGGIYCNHGASPVIANCIIKDNAAEFDGGGVFCNLLSAPVIANNKFINNSAITSGGGVRSMTGAVKLTNNLLVGNTARVGGAISCGDTLTTMTASHEYIINNTIVSNGATYGGAIYCYAVSSASISNNIIAFNARGIFSLAGTGAPALKNNCVYGNDGGNYAGVLNSTTDILVDPQLASATYGNLHIQSSSPCKNAGNGAEVIAGWLDIDNQSRVVGTVDIGADESDGTTYSVTPTIVRVATTGNDTNNGSSWALAKKTIQAAILSLSKDGGEVWVKAGTYNECVVLQDFAYTYGGFAGTETSRTQRNWTTNLTIIDPQAIGAAVSASSLGYRISAIDGFKLQNGKSLNGAGVFCRNASPLIMNNTITACAASRNGGGVYLANSSALVKANSIINNSALGNGGGVFCIESTSEVSRNNIEDNWACVDGCGVFASTNDMCKLINNKIIKNHQNPTIGGAWGVGVAVDSYSNLVMICNTVADNGAGNGAIYAGVFGNMTMYSNIVAFNNSGIVKGVNATVSQTATFTADPLFVSRAGGNYNLQIGSACIDAADPTTAPSEDFAGTTRPIDGDSNGSAIADIGCYENGVFVPENPIAPTSASVIPSSICSGASVTLHATGGSGITLRWLTGGCDGTSVGTGNDLVVSPTSTTTYYARWETSLGNSTCAQTTVTITGIGPTATVGGPQAIPPQGTTVGLGGNTPDSPATGAWSVVSGGIGTFSSITDPNATFTHTSGSGPVVLRWTVSSPPCPAVTANVIVTIAYNCLQNGSFDGASTGGIADGWIKQAPEYGTWTIDTTTIHSGVASQKIIDSSGAPNYTTWLYQTVSVKPGKVYVPTMWIYRVGNTVVHIGIDPNGGTSFSAGDATPTSNTWVYRVDDAFTAGSTEAVTIGLACGYNGGMGTVYFDDVAIKPQAPQLSGGTTTINSGNSATLTASGGFGGDASELCWYTGPVGTGTKVGTGTSFAVSPTSTTTYYPRWETSGGCGISDDGTTVTITVISTPVPPTVNSIAPSSGPNTGSTSITNLAGTGFLTGATVKLKRTGYTDIIATSVAVVSSTKITCSFGLTGKKTGLWDVFVQNTDGLSGTLANGFGISVSDSVPSIGMSIRGLLDSIMNATSLNRQVCVWGKVETINSSTFWLDDGSGTRIKVFAPGYIGIANGNYVSAIGSVDIGTNPPTLISSADRVVKHN